MLYAIQLREVSEVVPRCALYHDIAVRVGYLLEMSGKKHCGVKTIGTHDGTFHCDEVSNINF